MKKIKFNFGKLVLIFTAFFLFFIVANTNFAQDIRWLHVTDLQSPINEIGAEFEGEFPSSLLQNTNFFSWPAQYGLEQNQMRMVGLWIGCKNFNDPVELKLKSVKVIGSGPRDAPTERPNQIFEKEIKLVGKFNHPLVFVDDQPATLNATYDNVDEIDESMDADRTVVVEFNTSIGISVTKKVMVFTSPNHGNYYIHDYVFKNTGIYNRAGDVKQQTLQDVYFYWIYRHAIGGEAISGFGSTWGAFESAWGENNVNHAFGNDPNSADFTNPNSPIYNMRGYYSWYAPSHRRTLSYAEDWGCPNEAEDGRLGAVQFVGNVTLHADKSADDNSDDPFQPKTTWFIGSDITAMSGNVSQYNEIFMDDRYQIMSEGHPDKPHDTYVGDDYAMNYADPRRQSGGGTSQGQGYGPYTLEFGDSVRIVFASGVSGISREKNREVGKNWLQWYKQTAQPALVLPDGSITTDHNLYKRRWVETGKDSILKIFQNALNNYQSGYKLPQPPPPPEQFNVNSGGDRIRLSWSDNAVSSPHFDGYVIYRSVGNVLDPHSKYEKIFECSRSNVVHTYDDLTPVRGFDYYYYIQSKDDGTQNEVEPGKPLYSSLHWTITSLPATLQREAIPSTPLPFGFTTTKWVLMVDRGDWNSNTRYFSSDSTSDVVSYNGSIYACIYDSSFGTTTPDVNSTEWKPITTKGAWASGAKYNAYDAVTVGGTNYYTPFSISGGQGLELVRVVPNPYDLRSRIFQFGDKSQYDRIAFYGLPAVCKLKVFTERGDLIWEMDHTRGTGDELWDSKTSSGQIVSSGIYILYVETPDGQKVIRKFVIIR